MVSIEKLAVSIALKNRKQEMLRKLHGVPERRTNEKRNITRV